MWYGDHLRRLATKMKAKSVARGASATQGPADDKSVNKEVWMSMGSLQHVGFVKRTQSGLKILVPGCCFHCEKIHTDGYFTPAEMMSKRGVPNSWALFIGTVWLCMDFVCPTSMCLGATQRLTQWLCYSSMCLATEQLTLFFY